MRKDIEINHEKVAKETIMDESTIIIDEDNGLSIAEMLESIIRTEEESALEPTTDNRIPLDVARRLIGQTSETQKLFQRILQIHGKKMRESHTEEEIVVNVHSNDREFRKVTMPINSTIQDVHDKMKYDNDDVTFHVTSRKGNNVDRSRVITRFNHTESHDRFICE